MSDLLLQVNALHKASRDLEKAIETFTDIIGNYIDFDFEIADHNGEGLYFITDYGDTKVELSVLVNTINTRGELLLADIYNIES